MMAVMTDKDTEDAAEVAVSALRIYYYEIVKDQKCKYTDDNAALIAASNLVAADTIASAILEARP